MRILQVGLGPVGIKIAKYIKDKTTIETVGAVDTYPNFIGKTLFELDNYLSQEIVIENTINNAIKNSSFDFDVAIVTTVSSLEKLIPTIEELAKHKIPIVSTCEELMYSWSIQPELSKRIDEICKENGIACIGTGVNPGFLMDYLPASLSSICKDLEFIKIERIQDATPRRVPFQQKIGAGLDLISFEEKKKQGILRHVGLR